MSANDTIEEIIPRLDRYSDQREHGMSDILDVRQAQRFTELHPEIYFSTRNSELLQGWIYARGGCISVRNLEIATRELSKAGALEMRPAQSQPVVPKPNYGSDRGVIRVAPVFVPDAISPEDRAQFLDKPFEPDAARKKRDEQLRRAAIADRITRRGLRQ